MLRITRVRQPNLKKMAWEGLPEEATLRDLIFMTLSKRLLCRGCSAYNSPETQAGFIYARNSEKACVLVREKPDKWGLTRRVLQFSLYSEYFRKLLGALEQKSNMIQATFLKDHPGIQEVGGRSYERQDRKDRGQTSPEAIAIAQANDDDNSLGQGGSQRCGGKGFHSEYNWKIVLQDLLMDWMRNMTFLTIDRNQKIVTIT